MGAWGYKVNENDGACDFYDSLTGLKDATKIVEKTLKSGYPEEIRAIAQFLMAVRKYAGSAWLFDDHFARAKAALEDLVSDRDWIDSWDEPATAKRELKKQLATLNKLVD